MKLQRSSGILLHITSLPGPFGTGTLGRESKQFADTAKEAGFKYWQILPIGPVNGALGYSPYATSSAFAGNPLFISLESLADEPWFKRSLDLKRFPQGDFVLFDDASAYNQETLLQAFNDFQTHAFKSEKARFSLFCSDQENWLDDFALFTSLSEHFGTSFWPGWEKSIAQRKPASVKSWSQKLNDRVEFHKFEQFLFFNQWTVFKQYVNDIGIDLIGDIPIYITLESADAWSHPEILHLDENTGLPSAVAGVPPDYFSETGQRWGNPVYRWRDDGGNLDENTVSWWIRRIRHLRGFVDVIRIDHFRGFESFWSIPFKEKTAVKGEWMPGPGEPFFLRLKNDLGDLPLIAEDLGVITPEVEKLRDDLGFPGMKILQFAFDFNNENYYLPHNIEERNCLLYTGTHDNNTTNGWFYGDEINDETRSYVMEYIGTGSFDALHWHLIRLAYGSVANIVIIPAQDVLGYGQEFRMNKPGTVTGNWGWKLREGALKEEIVTRLKRMGKLYRRLPDQTPADTISRA